MLIKFLEKFSENFFPSSINKLLFFMKKTTNFIFHQGQNHLTLIDKGRENKIGNGQKKVFGVVWK
jgi:hypothetical protein